MKRHIPTNTFESIFKNLYHLKLAEDQQALLAMMIKFAYDKDQNKPWSWLNFATILYAARKNAGTRRWFYNTKEGTKLSKDELKPYLLQLTVWQEHGWLELGSKPYDNSLKRSSSWAPLPSPKANKKAPYYSINLDNIADFGSRPSNHLFNF